MTTFQLEETNLRPISHSETLLINEAQDNLKKTSDQKIYKFGFGQSPFSPPISAVESLKRLCASTRLFACCRFRSLSKCCC